MEERKPLIEERKPLIEERKPEFIEPELVKFEKLSEITGGGHVIGYNSGW
jgi:hypothetical protein